MPAALTAALRRPWRIIPYLMTNHVHPWAVARMRGVEVRGKLRVRGWPIVDVRHGGRITIGHNVLLNSVNRGYHTNMHSPVKLYADQEGALIEIGDHVKIKGACIHAFKHIKISDYAGIAANTHIMDGTGHDLDWDALDTRLHMTSHEARPVLIGEYVWVAINCIILPGVTIGKGAVVGAGSVVTRDIPPFCVAAGNPAKVIRDYSQEVANANRTT